MSRRKRKNNSQFSLFVFQDIITCVMGIMLLLTLMMCLQITATVASDTASPVEQTLDEMKQQAADLAAEVMQLQQLAGEQIVLLNSGAIEDPELIKEQSLTMENENQLANETIRELWQQHTENETSLESIIKTDKDRQAQISETETLRDDNRNLSKRLDELKRGDRVIYNAHNSSATTCWLVELTNATTIQAAELGKSIPPLSFTSQTDLQFWMLQRQRSGAVFLILVKPDAADSFELLSEELRLKSVTFGFDLLPQDKLAIDPILGAAAQ